MLCSCKKKKKDHSGDVCVNWVGLIFVLVCFSLLLFFFFKGNESSIRALLYCQAVFHLRVGCVMTIAAWRFIVVVVCFVVSLMTCICHFGSR